MLRTILLQKGVKGVGLKLYTVVRQNYLRHPQAVELFLLNVRQNYKRKFR